MEILYKFYFEGEQNIKQKPYYIMKDEHHEKLTIEDIKKKIIEDGYNESYLTKDESYLTKVKYKYLLKKQSIINSDILEKEEDHILKDLKELKEDESINIQKDDFRLYLHIILGLDKAQIKKEIEAEKEKEINEIGVQFSNLEQVRNEIEEMKQQIYHIEHDLKHEKNEMIRCIKKNLKANKTILESSKKDKTEINFRKKEESGLIGSCSNIIDYNKIEDEPEEKNKINEANNSIENKSNYSKIIFLFSSLLSEKKQYYEQDYSYYKHFLVIYNTLKKKQSDIKIELHLKQLLNDIFCGDKPHILHIRIDSYIEENEIKDIYFKLGDESSICKLDTFVKKFETTKNLNLKLLIISSQNIEKIKNKFDQLKMLEKINKIYINYSKEQEEKEIEFIQNLYEILFYDNKKLKAFVKEKNNKHFIFDFKNEHENYFEYKNIKIEPEFINSNKSIKHLLTHEIMKNNYCIIGRSKELDINLKKYKEKKWSKFYIYGAEGVGKKSFAKKLGFLFYERDIFDKVYFLEINPIDNPEMKINIIIDRILEYNNDREKKDMKHILLIIYFNEIITKINDLHELILKIETKKRNKISLYFNFTFTLASDNLDYCKKIFKDNYIKLTQLSVFGKNKEININNFIDFYKKEKLINLIDKFKDFSQRDNCKGATINNIFLLEYIDYIKDNNITDDEIIKKIILDDDLETKKKIILGMIKHIENLKEIFLYLVKLNSGIGKSSLEILLGNNNISNIIEKLNGIIVVENNENEEIYRLDNSFKTIIEEIFNDKEYNEKEILKKIMENYFKLFRNLIKDYTSSEGFYAFIPNPFWNYEYKSGENKNIIKNQNNNNKYIFNNEIDTNNIYYIINNINENEYFKDGEKYIDDISISLPSLLYINDNFYYLCLIIETFEKLFLKLKTNNDQIKFNELILRLGIFNYWVTKKPNFYERALRLADISDKKNINLNKDAKFEYYLSKIFDCIIKKDPNIDEYREQCYKILYEEENIDNIKIKNEEGDVNSINIIRLEKLCEATTKIENKNKLFFLLEDPLENELINLNKNFYLTQKLLAIIPTDFDVKFRTCGNEEQIKFEDFFKLNNQNIKNINFIYLSNNKFKKSFLEYCKKNNINIKILILGEFDDTNEETKKIINNLIYINKKGDNINLKEIFEENNKSYEYYLERYYIEFIHDFVSNITSKYHFCTIKEAFNKAERNFISKLENIIMGANSKKFKNNKNMIKFKDMIKFESKIDDDIFEVNYVYEGENDINQKKIIDDLYDEYEYECNKLKNLYYRKNPFSSTKNYQSKKRIFKKYMKLPGNEYLSHKNFVEFVDKEIYKLNKEKIIEAKKLIEKNKIINIYGNLDCFQFGDELCKYFYIEGKYQDGIFIVSSSIKIEEFKSLIGPKKKNGIKDILILIKMLDIKDKDNIISMIKFYENPKNSQNSPNIIIISEKSLGIEKNYKFDNLIK